MNSTPQQLKTAGYEILRAIFSADPPEVASRSDRRWPLLAVVSVVGHRGDTYPLPGAATVLDDPRQIMVAVVPSLFVSDRIDRPRHQRYFCSAFDWQHAVFARTEMSPQKRPGL